MARRSRRTEPSAGPEKGSKTEGRFRRHLRLAQELREQPRRAVPMLRGLFVEAWRSRGGGFYGLGYVVTFLYLEVNVLVTDVLTSDSVGSFALGQIVEYVLRFSLFSFLNVFQAFLWPFFVLEHLGGVGIILLLAGLAAFEYALKPVVERIFPELKEPVSAKPDQ